MSDMLSRRRKGVQIVEQHSAQREEFDLHENSIEEKQTTQIIKQLESSTLNHVDFPNFPEPPRTFDNLFAPVCMLDDDELFNLLVNDDIITYPERLKTLLKEFYEIVDKTFIDTDRLIAFDTLSVVTEMVETMMFENFDISQPDTTSRDSNIYDIDGCLKSFSDILEEYIASLNDIQLQEWLKEYSETIIGMLRIIFPPSKVSLLQKTE